MSTEWYAVSVPDKEFIWEHNVIRRKQELNKQVPMTSTWL